MRRPSALTKLIDTLDRLFDDEQMSRLIVDRAGLDDRMIAYDPRSIVNWTNIVNEAVKQNGLGDLVDAATQLRPDVPELKEQLAEYEKWAAQRVSTPALTAAIDSKTPVNRAAIELGIDERAPGFFERARVAIVAWFSIGVGCFALIGILARESTHIFLGLPGSHFGDAFTEPGAAAAEGLRFVGRTLVLAGIYAGSRPIVFTFAIVIAAVFIFFSVRRPKLVNRAYLPVVIVPLIIVASIAKVLWFDLPTVFFEDVLSRYTVDVATFDAPAMRQRVESIWTDVVCSRVANLGTEETRRICGRRSNRAASLHGIARHLLNVIFTITICGFGVAAIRKLVIPSANPRWNLPRTWKWALIGATSTAVLAALLAVPWTYARTVASMDLPYVCSGADCSSRICADDCYDLDESLRWVKIDPARDNGAEVGTRDVLAEAFRAQLGAPQLDPQDRSTRYP